jgi:5'-3' exonuclease
MRGILLIDGMSIAHAANANKPLAVGDQPTQAVFGFLRSLRLSVSKFPTFTPLIAWDGASWRNNFYADYKVSRNKFPEKKYEIEQAATKAQLKSQKTFIRQALGHLGVRQIAAWNLEADDIAGIVVKRKTEGTRILMISGDKDWVQLIRPQVGWFDPIRDVSITPGTLYERLGVKTPRAWLECKALMGDPSDNIPGVGGIGEKGAKELLNTYGSVVEFRNMVIDKTIKVETLPKKFRELAEAEEKHEIFLRNMRLMDLNHPDIPAPVQLTISSNKQFSLEAFHDLCTELQFNSIVRDLETWCAPFCAHVNNEETINA